MYTVLERVDPDIDCLLPLFLSLADDVAALHLIYLWRFLLLARANRLGKSL